MMVLRAIVLFFGRHIGYVFNTIQTRMQMDVNRVGNVFALVNKINTIIGGIPFLKHYFIHVGFLDNLSKYYYA